MIFLLTMILALAIGYLWTEVHALRQRIETLELTRYWSSESMPLAETAGEAPPERLYEPVPVAQPVPDIVPEPVPHPEPASPWLLEHEDPVVDQARSLGFEDIFGRRLPIWAGGVTLAVAGFLIVKYSIEAGLLSPATRVILGMLFGTFLIGGAEAAMRAQDAVRDIRVRQALCGAGIATWFAAILVAVDLYHLVAPMIAFVGMAGVTAVAALLSLRFGAPSAVLGLIGGLAAPALIGSNEPNIPLLSLYLALTVGGLSVVASRERWWWLGAAALTGGFGWGLLLILNGLIGLSQTLSVGLFTLALAAGFPLLLTGGRPTIVRLIAGVAGCAQMAALVALGGFALLDWGLFGLLSIAALWLSRREAALAEVPALGLGVAILLAEAWPGPPAYALALVLTGIALIHAAPAALRVWTPVTRLIDAPMVAAVALAIAILPALHFPHLPPLLRAWPALAGVALAAGVAGWGWFDPTRCTGGRFAILAGAAAAALALADAFGLAAWTIAPAIALLAFGLQLLGIKAANRMLEYIACGFGLASLLFLLSMPHEASRWIGSLDPADWIAFVRWSVPAAAAVGFAWCAPMLVARIAQALAALLFYSACAQVIPGDWLSVMPSLLLVALAATGLASLRPAAGAAAALAIGWALFPLISWLVDGMAALAGETSLAWFVGFAPAIRQLALPALALGVAANRLPMPHPLRVATSIAAALVGLVAVHIAYRHLIPIKTEFDFIARGMMERTIWEIGLALAATGAWAIHRPRTALLLGGIALAHFGWFTMLLHDPLWRDQDVGPWLVPAYAAAFALVWASGWPLPQAQRVRDGAMMALIVMFAFSALRQIAHGTMPLWQGVDGREDIGRSVLAIALGVGFLRYGIAAAARDWRIVSLGLMLVAVGKVFLFDASGLDGLLRIGAFAALGSSLIGIGWLYSRYLPDDRVRP